MAKSVKALATDVSPYLKQARVQNYPPLRDAQADFKPGLNIIIGKNGAGKTRFLTLLSELADLHEQKEHFGAAGCKVVFGGIFGGKVDAEIEFEEQAGDGLTFEPQKALVKPVVHIDTLSANEKQYVEKPEQLNYLLASYAPILIRHGTPATGLPILDESAEIILEKRSVTVTLKDGPRRINDLNSQFVQALFRALYRLVRLGFTAIQGVPVPPMTGEAVRYQLSRLIAAYTERLTYYLPLYSPVQAVRCVEYFQVYYQEMQDQYSIKGLVLEYQVNSQWLSFGLLSDGTKRLVYILAEILAPDVVALNKNTDEITVYDKRKIILLEEPELGIHHSQLHKLLQLIREASSESQIIMTTHAPQVLDMLGADELDRITICSLDPEKGTQFHKLSEEKQEQAHVYMKEVGFLSDYWRYSYLEETEAE
ncbi:AAA family ATPase [Hymenobacter sp. PAMC 26628]|uniref:AAA family ATPase n=1 Tax=Hymenobacter sp. PAMC 26628 TaxID=1484118 RepID=UPI00076FFC07|nr:ATP-binding protein [Hymenobacter sp. PAMC 26628]AMJ64188.1 hypothetical protein AXW84_01115 [Hymenobacter sp. PAMC 26628]